MSSNPHDPSGPDGRRRPANDALRPAILHVIMTVVVTLLAFVGIAVTDGATETGFAIAAQAVALVGALSALWRSYLSWRAGGRWQVWQGAGWFLLAFFLIVMTNTAGFLLPD